MSKLDDILSGGLDGTIYEDTGDGRTFKAKESKRTQVKQSLKQLFLDMLEDEEIYGVGVGSDEKRGANQLRAELRSKLEQL